MKHHEEEKTRNRSTGTENPRRRTALACAAAVALAGMGVGAAEGSAAAQVAVRVDALQQVVDLVNAERAEAGCGAVRVDDRARAAAQTHADDMAARDYYDHTSPEGTDAGDRLDAAGYPWQKLGENIHKGPTTAEEAMRDWMNSDDHRANILDCGLVDLGVGLNTGGTGPYWVQVFATPRG